MIHTITVRNVNGALSEGMLLLSSRVKSEERQTRNGPTKRATGPVIIETIKPMERVLFSPARNANPFFHLFESLWMLAGRNDLPWLVQFNKQMASYSDDGGLTQPAAYGYRWRNYFGVDQIEAVLDHLTRDPNSRRAVMGMWNPGGERDNSIMVGVNDLYAATNGSKDVPCNTQIYFGIRDTAKGAVLDMTVTCRSNDALWGAHGANAVHFSVLQEYMAAGLTVGLRHPIGVGRMVQFANDYHYYPEVMKETPERLAIDASDHDHYDHNDMMVRRMFPEGTGEEFAQFNASLLVFMNYADPENPVLTSSQGGGNGKRKNERPRLANPFLNEVAMPMLQAWDAHKVYDYERAMQLCHTINAPDWREACRDWMTRATQRYETRKAKK